MPDGTVVTVTRIPRPSAQPVLGWYRRGEAERLDLIAYQFVKDADPGWLLCDVNDAVVRTRSARTSSSASRRRER